MDCSIACDRLLEAEDLSHHGLVEAGLAEHVAQCADCQKLVADLLRAEDAWRVIPLPASAEQARDRFLESRPWMTQAKPRRVVAPRWLLAASLLLALGLGVTMFVSLPRASASSDVVERLVDWNLSLARASSPGERSEIYTGRAAALADEVKQANLLAEDRDLAESLLRDAPWLARNADPLAEADRFNDVADRLLNRMNRATRGGDSGRLEQSARLYRRVVELGIESKVAVLEQSGALDFEHQHKLERVVLRDSDRMLALVALLERAPDSTRKEIKRALSVTAQRPKKTQGQRAEAKARRDARVKSRGAKSERVTPPVDSVVVPER